MNYSEQRAAIETKFLSGWDSMTTPIKFDNSKGLRKGTSSVEDETKLKEWCSVRIMNETANPGAINIKMVRHTGAIYITVFTEAGKGSNRARVLADAVSTIMQSTSSDQLVLYPAQIAMSGPTPDATFYQAVIEVPFSVDQYL